MPKLLITVNSLRTGIGIVASNIAKSLTDNYEVHILTSENGLTNANRRVSVHLVPRGCYPFRTMTYSTILRPLMSKVIRQISPDIVHSFSVLPWAYTYRSEERTKTIVSPSGTDVYPRKARPIYNYFVDHALCDSFAVVCFSKWLSKYVLENYHVRSVVIPTGVDTQIFRPLGDSARGKVVLFVGRLIKEKGVLDLVKAVRALPEYEFWLAGSGPLKIPTLPNVKMLGFHDNTVPLYASASVCAFPFHHDNFPLVGLEAMACGRAIVATEPGFSEYVENGKDGILMKPHDVRSLTDSIRYLMEDEKARKRLERNARKKAIQYDWTVTTKKFEEFYEAL